MKIQNLLLPSIALGAAVLLMTPQESQGFNLLGHSLSPNQSDFRVFNNFIDSNANNNTTVIDQFPGYSGAVVAIWKGCVEWASGAHGDGSGDPHQGILGSGGSSFDPIFNGEANGTGNIGDNILSSLNQNGGGVLAFMQGGSSGWWIRFYENWTWNDGPGTGVPGSHVDLQGTTCHEYGHSVGLDHTFVGGSPTMSAFSNGTGVVDRSLTNDDAAGIQAVYGLANSSGTKPTISQIINLGGTIRVIGTNFTLNNNQVWFTKLTPGSTGGSGGNPIKLSGLSSTNSNTEILLSVPVTAGPGDILVKRNSSGQESTSAPFPFDPFEVPPPTPIVTNVSPAQVEPLSSTGTPQVILTGSGFTGATDLVVNGKIVGDPSTTFTGNWSVDSDTQISFNMPLTGSSGLVDIDFNTPGGAASAQIEIVEPASSVLAVNSVILIQAAGLGIATSGPNLDFTVLKFSVVDGATVLPGFFELEIGGGLLSNIFSGKIWTLGPKFWRKLDTGPLSGLPLGVEIFFEGLVYPVAQGYNFPLGSTNKTSVIVFS